MWNKATVKVDKDKFLAWVKDNEIQMKNVIEVGDKMKVRVFGIRYELNDNYISVIVQLLSKI